MDTDLFSVYSVCSVDKNHLPRRTRMDTDLFSVYSVCSVDNKSNFYEKDYFDYRALHCQQGGQCP